MSSSKQWLSQIAEIISATSSLVWPLIFIVALWFARNHLSSLILLAIKRIEQASDIEIGSIKLKGAIISQKGEVIKADIGGLKIINASQSDLDERHDLHAKLKCLMLVHTIKP